MLGALRKLVGLDRGAAPRAYLVGNRERLKPYADALPANDIEGRSFDTVADMLQAASAYAPAGEEPGGLSGFVLRLLE